MVMMWWCDDEGDADAIIDSDDGDDECAYQSRGWLWIKSTLCANCFATWFNCAFESYHDYDDDDDEDDVKDNGNDSYENDDKL